MEFLLLPSHRDQGRTFPKLCPLREQKENFYREFCSRNCGLRYTQHLEPSQPSPCTQLDAHLDWEGFLDAGSLIWMQSLLNPQVPASGASRPLPQLHP